MEQKTEKFRVHYIDYGACEVSKDFDNLERALHFAEDVSVVYGRKMGATVEKITTELVMVIPREDKSNKDEEEEDDDYDNSIIQCTKCPHYKFIGHGLEGCDIGGNYCPYKKEEKEEKNETD